MDDAREFLGRGLAWPVAVDHASGRVRLSEYEGDIAEAVEVILATRKGERIMRPDFGSNLHRFVFEGSGGSVRAEITREAVRALERWEPRITDLTAEVRFPPGRDGFVLELAYTVRSTNNRFNLVFPYFLTEGETP